KLVGSASRGTQTGLGQNHSFLKKDKRTISAIIEPGSSQEDKPMIRSMTAFASARLQSPQGSLTLELRSVNNRYLDLGFRLPEDLRPAEAPLRETISQSLKRGKIELRASYH